MRILVSPFQLWNTFHSAEDVKPSLQESLNLLGLKYLDLYLIHWPTAYQVCIDACIVICECLVVV